MLWLLLLHCFLLMMLNALRNLLGDSPSTDNRLFGSWKNDSHNTLTKYIQYLDHSIKNVEETRLSLPWHALLHLLTFINYLEQAEVRCFFCKLPIQVRNDHSSMQQLFYQDLYVSLIEISRWTNGLSVTHGASGQVNWICSQEIHDKILGLLKSSGQTPSEISCLDFSPSPSANNVMYNCVCWLVISSINCAKSHVCTKLRSFEEEDLYMFKLGTRWTGTLRWLSHSKNSIWIDL